MALSNDDSTNDHVFNTNSMDNIFRVCTYNMHGFNQGSEMLNYLCCNVHPDIIFIQEHWQSPDNLPKLLGFSSDFIGFGISAFESKLGAGILYGRPYGGVCILAHKKYSKLFKTVICCERYVIVIIGSIAFVNVYFPCKSNLKSNEHLDIIHNLIDEINSHLSAHAHELVIFGGDLNTDLRNNSLVNDSIHSFAQELNLMVSTTVVASNIDYSFHAVSSGHRSLIDWLLLSSVLGPSVVAMNILDSEPNLSDHLPIVLDFKFSDLYLSCADDLKLHTSLDTQRSTTRNLNWDHANLDAYYDISRVTLQPVLDELRPIYLKLMNNFAYSRANDICASSKSNNVSDYSICRDISVYLIDKFYPLLTNALVNAANCTVSKVKTAVSKHWWSTDLQNEKNKSIDSHHIWVDAGRPRSGPIFDLYKKQKYAYKFAVRNAKCDSELSITNDLHDALCCKDAGSFWKIWHSNFNLKNSNNPKIVGGLTDRQEIEKDLLTFSMTHVNLTPMYSMNHHQLDSMMLFMNIKVTRLMKTVSSPLNKFARLFANLS